MADAQKEITQKDFARGNERNLFMKKQKIQLIALLIVLVACIGGYFGASAYSKKKQAEEEKEESYTALTLGEDAEITGITVSGAEASYALVKEDDTWKFADNADAKVTESSVTTMTEDLAEITGDNEIADVTDFAQYGLDDPQLTIQFTLSDGTGHTVKIGDKNSTISRYYLQVDDSTTVYTVTSTLYSTFNKTVEDLTDTSEDDSEDTSEDASEDASEDESAAQDSSDETGSESVSDDTADAASVGETTEETAASVSSKEAGAEASASESTETATGSASDTAAN